MDSNYEATLSTDAYLEPAHATPTAVFPYVSSKRRSIIVVSLFTIGIFLCLALIAGNFEQFQLMDRLRRDEPVSDLDIDTNDKHLFVLSCAWLLWYLGIVTAFLMWRYRAHRNLPSLGATGLEFSPRGAVGWYFAPFLNLFKPYQCMREIYNASEPAPVEGFEWRRRNAPAVLKLWWMLFLVMCFLGNAVTREQMRADTVESFQILNVASIILEIISIGALLAAIWLVWSITRRQELRAATLGLSN